MEKEISSDWLRVCHRCNKILPTCHCKCKTNVSKVSRIIQNDDRYTFCHIAKAVGISLLRVHLIFKRRKKISAWWIPHIYDQKRIRVQTAKQLLNLFPRFNQRQLQKSVSDETRVHYFEPVRKTGRKIWLTKLGRRPVVAKRTISHQLIPQRST